MRPKTVSERTVPPAMPSASAHPSPYSGSWYPDDPTELTELLGRLWRTSEERTGPDLLPDARGFVVPHAGLIYSGAVAAAAYRHIQLQQPERIILMGFCHRGCPSGVSLPEIERFRTPLGELDIDRACVERLLTAPHFRSMPEVGLCDHSVEIQLPLIQKAAPAARIVPLYVGHLDPASRMEVAATLAQWAMRGTVFVASSDFTHFGAAFHYSPFPVDERTGDRLRELDSEIADAASSLRPKLFLEALRETSATVCGYEPIALLLELLHHAPGADEIYQQELDYQTSGEITKDYHHSVSYASLGYFPHTAFELGIEEQVLLLDAARGTLKAFQESAKRRPPAPGGQTSALDRRCGVFVTLRKNGQLRGCLGRTSHLAALRESVPELTLAAALEDRRFDPVSPSEPGIEVEISVLTPMKRLVETADFRVNIHGGFLKARGRQGLLLPQVAAGRDWSAGQFIEALARKAGLSTDALSDPASRLYVFRAQVIPRE